VTEKGGSWREFARAAASEKKEWIKMVKGRVELMEEIK